MIPALFTSTSSGPAASRKPANDSSSVTSSSWPVAAPPSEAAAPSASPPSRSPIATRAPRLLSACAVASPIPRAAPVIATTRVTAWTLCGGRAAGLPRRRLARRCGRVLGHVVRHALAQERDRAVGLEHGGADVVERLVALPARDRLQFR